MRYRGLDPSRVDNGDTEAARLAAVAVEWIARYRDQLVHSEPDHAALAATRQAMIAAGAAAEEALGAP